MSFLGMLNHDLTIRRSVFDEGDPDDYGQPGRSVTTTAVKGQVQPRRMSEVRDSRSAGVELSTHVIFLPAGTDIRHADAVDWGDRRLQVVGVHEIAFGSVPHLEVDADLVTSTPVIAAGS